METLDSYVYFLYSLLPCLPIWSVITYHVLLQIFKVQYI